MQNAKNLTQLESTGERTLDYSKDLIDGAVIDEPKIKTIVGPEINHIDGRRDTNQTAQLQQPRDKSDLKSFARDDLRYSSASNISDNQNLHSAKQLQAALPSNFEVKIKKIGTQVATANQSKKQLVDGDYYQGAPPNYFMRKGSATSSLSNGKTTPNLTPMDRYDSKTTALNLEETNKVIFGQPRNEKSAQISLAVETRNAMTGTRKKIIKSAVHSLGAYSLVADDRQSDQTQTEIERLCYSE